MEEIEGYEELFTGGISKTIGRLEIVAGWYWRQFGLGLSFTWAGFDGPESMICSLKWEFAFMYGWFTFNEEP